MANPLNLSSKEMAGLLEVVNAHHDDDHKPQNKRYRWRVTGLERRAAQLMRVTGQLDESADIKQWGLPNTALRLELPVQPDELVGIEGAPTTASRVYTVADINTEAREISVDFVVHEGDSPAMTWLREAKPGTEVELWPPVQHRLPGPWQNRILVCDPTGLPAALSILRHMDLPGRTRLLTNAPQDQVPDLAGVEVVRTDEPLGDAFLALDLDQVDSVWGAAESGQMKIVRTHCRREMGLGKEQTQVYGYWRQGTSNTSIDIQRLRMARDAMADGVSPEDLEERMEDML